MFEMHVSLLRSVVMNAGHFNSRSSHRCIQCVSPQDVTLISLSGPPKPEGEPSMDRDEKFF